MKRILAGMTFDEITGARKLLFATGTMELRDGQMVPLSPEFLPFADLYNRLAASHGLAAQAGEAGTAETAEQGSVHEHAVPKGDAPK